MHLEDAVKFLSFNSRYGNPTNIRRLLSVALENQMISRSGNQIAAEFMYDLQKLSPNQATKLGRNVSFKDSVELMI